MAYMLPRGPYDEYVLSQADEEDVSCVFKTSVLLTDAACYR